MTDTLIFFGDFNARVGCDYTTWDGVLGKHGVGGSAMVFAYDKHVPNTNFLSLTHYSASQKETVQPQSWHWHFIDYAIVRAKDRQDVRVTKYLYVANCWADYRLIITKLNLRLQPNRHPQGKKAPKRLNKHKWLDCSDTKQSLEGCLRLVSLKTKILRPSGRSSWSCKL